MKQYSPTRDIDLISQSPVKNPATSMGRSQTNFLDQQSSISAEKMANLSTIQPPGSMSGRSYIETKLPYSKNISNASTHGFTDTLH
jgi:hypothetical protein